MRRLVFWLLALIAVVSCVPAPAPPVIVALSISPTEITAGDSATLLWNVTGATTVTIDQGIGDVPAAGTKVISPATTTVYTLTATNAAGTVSKSVVVTVGAVTPPPPPPPLPPPPAPGLPVVVDFAASPSIILAGGSSTLSWNVTGAAWANIDQGIGGIALPTGTRVVSPATTTVYTLTASNAAGSVSKSVVVTVGAVTPPPPAPDTTPPTVPVLLSPGDGVTLPQKTAPWIFDWADSSDPESGIKQYQLQVYRPGVTPFIDVYVITSNYSRTVEVAYAYLSNWRWKVRAQNNAGLWSAWSAERTFNVQPRTATVTLLSIAAEDGHVKEDGGTNPYPNVGDDSTNKALQAFLSFDISGIPSGAAIKSASLDLSTGDMLGDPFGGLGWMRVYNHQYGSLDSGDFTPGFPTGAMYTYSSRPVAPFTSSELISKLQAQVVARSLRFQVRVQFQKYTDNDNAVDCLRFGEVKLVITYDY